MTTLTDKEYRILHAQLTATILAGFIAKADDKTDPELAFKYAQDTVENILEQEGIESA